MNNKSRNQTLLIKAIAFVCLILLSHVASLHAGNPLKSPPNKTNSKGQKYKDAGELVRAMHAEAAENRLKEYTFTQETIRFKKDGSVRDTMIWYEALRYPDQFRIDFGLPEDGNSVIYRSDSVYVFRDGELHKSKHEYQELLLLEGGLKMYAVDSVLARLKRYGYDLKAFHKTKFEGKKVYVIGAKKKDMDAKQIWIDAERLIPLRRIDPRPDGKRMEVIYGGFEAFSGGWIETTVLIKMDGQVLQTEKYMDIDVQPELKDILFEPWHFGDWHWK